MFCLQDNVFVTVVASIQYRALAEKASDAFYKLSNTKEQIQAYVFDGNVGFSTFFYIIIKWTCVSVSLLANFDICPINHTFLFFYYCSWSYWFYFTR